MGTSNYSDSLIFLHAEFMPSFLLKLCVFHKPVCRSKYLGFPSFSQAELVPKREENKDWNSTAELSVCKLKAMKHGPVEIYYKREMTR